MQSSQINSSKEKRFRKLRKKKIWPSIVFFAVELIICPCLIMIFVQFFASYVVETKLEQMYQEISHNSRFINNVFENGQVSPQAVERLKFYITNDSDICVVDRNSNVLANTGTSTPDFNMIFEMSLNEEFKVIADSKENYIYEQGLYSMPDILQRLIEETFDKSDKVLRNDWLHDVIMEQKLWIHIPTKNKEYRFYQKFTLQILRQDVFFMCMFGIFAIVMILIPMLFLFINTIRAIATQRKMIKMIYQDIVTGGWNWLYFQNFSRNILARHKNRKKTYAIISLHLERYNNYCACYGVKAGEELLERMNGFLNARIGKGEIHAVYEGADFALLIQCRGHDDEECRNYCQKRINSLLAELTGLNPEQKLSFKTGIYMVYPSFMEKERIYSSRKDMDINQIYTYANAAMFMAKNQKKSSAFFDKNMLDKQLWNQKVEKNMETALREEEFEVYLQPKYSPSDGKMLGAEALVRWNSKTDGFIPPNRFIPIFEENGFITQLDDYMVSKVAKLQSEWTIQGKKVVPVSVNISRAHFVQEGLAEHICQLVDAYGPKHELIELELTESAFFDDKNILTETVKQLKAYGFRVSMDDFGSGFSSLNSLKDIPLDVLKLDTGFFNGDTDSERGEIIVREIIRLARALDMTVVAEGIEKKEQVDFLAKLGCDMIQGYYFAKPMPVSEFEEKVEKDA